MTETKFEVGKKYRTKGGWPATITDIDVRGRLIVHHDCETVVSPVMHASNGAFHGWESDYDLLPAIEPEGAGMHPKVRQALVAMADLWGAFAGDIQTGLLDPCGGECFQLDGARIACGYESREAALTECRQIIESIDILLEGRAG